MRVQQGGNQKCYVSNKFDKFEDVAVDYNVFKRIVAVLDISRVPAPVVQAEALVLPLVLRHLAGVSTRRPYLQ